MAGNAPAEEGDATPFKWVECPRDAWQGLPRPIPSHEKAQYLSELLAAGFRHLDLGSFVSPKAVPQMADTEAVLASLERPADADFLCIVANLRGLERAAATTKVSSVGFPLSVNETFQMRNTGRDRQGAWRLVEELKRECDAVEIELVVYLSMGFGNPYGDPWVPADTAAAAARLADMGVQRISLADTVGQAGRAEVESVLDSTLGALAGTGWRGQLGLHLHSRPDGWLETVPVAWRHGIRWFEGALAGVGGCPFAGDELVGNLPSERVLPWLTRTAGYEAVPLDELPRLAALATRIATGVNT